MVAGGDKDRAAHVPQGEGQGLGGLPVGVLPVQQVAREQHQIGPPVPGQVGQPPGQRALLAAALGRPLRREGGEGGVQVEIRPV